jgi:hypothetical protein
VILRKPDGTLLLGRSLVLSLVDAFGLWTPYYVAQGALEGFPACCVLFYAVYWMPQVPAGEKRDDVHRRAFAESWRATFGDGPPGRGRLRCPRCKDLNR